MRFSEQNYIDIYYTIRLLKKDLISNPFDFIIDLKQNNLYLKGFYKYFTKILKYKCDDPIRLN